jgi:TonB family protein
LPQDCFRSPRTNPSPVGGIRRSFFSTILLLTFCLTTGLVPTSPAQKVPKFERKVLVSVKPEYPQLLKRARIGGLVRLRAWVLPNGSVTNVEVLGGNPILAASAVDAVKKWKFVPGSTETTDDITLDFNPLAD